MEALNYCAYSQKGSPLSLDNQRGIAISCAISMLRNKIVLHMIKFVAELKLHCKHCFLRSGLSTPEIIMTLRFLLDAARTQIRFLTVLFLD